MFETKLHIVPRRVEQRTHNLLEFCATSVKLFDGLAHERMQQLMRGAQLFAQQEADALANSIAAMLHIAVSDIFSMGRG